MRSEAEEKGLDAVNIDECVCIDVDTEAPLYNGMFCSPTCLSRRNSLEKGECIFCKAHHILEMNREHDCGYFKCGFPDVSLLR